MNDIQIFIEKELDMEQFLSLNGFSVEDLGNSVYSVVRDDELPVFVKVEDETLFFEVDLGNVSTIANEAFYFELLDLNTEILPVSLGINNSNPEDPRLVLVESREIGTLDDHEVLSVFDAMELAAEKVEKLLVDKIAQS
jgi:uncharacterized protein YjfI (DUF2170 family)